MKTGSGMERTPLALCSLPQGQNRSRSTERSREYQFLSLFGAGTFCPFKDTGIGRYTGIGIRFPITTTDWLIDHRTDSLGSYLGRIKTILSRGF